MYPESTSHTAHINIFTSNKCVIMCCEGFSFLGESHIRCKLKSVSISDLLTSPVKIEKPPPPLQSHS